MVIIIIIILIIIIIINIVNIIIPISGCNNSRWRGIPAGASGLCGLACFDGRRRAVVPG